jgi:hypothetical protein
MICNSVFIAVFVSACVKGGLSDFHSRRLLAFILSIVHPHITSANPRDGIVGVTLSRTRHVLSGG